MGRALNAIKSKEDPLLDYGNRSGETRQVDKMGKSFKWARNPDSNPSKIPVFKSGGTSVNRQNGRGSKKEFSTSFEKKARIQNNNEKMSGYPAC